MNTPEILKQLSEHPAVSGYEKNMSAYIAGLFRRYCDSVEVDRFYNVIACKKGDPDCKTRVMVTAHYDEIGLIVKSIDDKGFLRISNMGGVDAKILLAQEVVVHGRRDIPGVIGAKPPHLLKPDEAKNAVKLEALHVDCGMSAKELSDVVAVGDVITLKAETMVLSGDKVSSKAMDNRCGVAAMLEAACQLTLLKHSAEVLFVATTQEEFELGGATGAAYNLEPDAAVVIDACHGDMPDAPKEDTYVLGKGPAVAIGPNLNRELTNRIMDTAKRENIPYQVDVEPGSSGTEAWAIQVSRQGIPTALISIPLRYMHTPVETVHTADVRNAGRLTARYIASIGERLEGGI